MKADKLNGKRVIDSEGNIVGQVSGVDIDLADWTTKYIYVDLSDTAAKELRTKTSFWSTATFCFPIAEIKNVGDVITLTKNTRELENIAVKPRREESVYSAR